MSPGKTTTPPAGAVTMRNRVAAVKPLPDLPAAVKSLQKSQLAAKPASRLKSLTEGKK